jgi:hypothetical protein
LPQVRLAIEPLKPIDRLAVLDRVEFPGHKVAQQSPERLERLGRPKRLKAFERLGRPIVQGEERRRLAHLFDIEMDGEGERLLERPIRLFADHGEIRLEWNSGIGSVRRFRWLRDAVPVRRGRRFAVSLGPHARDGKAMTSATASPASQHA